MFGGQQGGGNNGGRPVTREATSLGSGFIISEDGYIVTNSHVVSGGQPGGNAVGSITVIMPDRKEYAAKLIGKDASSDLAVLKIEARGLPFVKFGDSSQTRVGDWIVAIGNPFGLGGSVTAGIVSALQRNIGAGPYDRYIQTDAAINRGNSGGPTFDIYGRVIGVNSAIFSPTGGSVGIGFAIPAAVARPITERLMRGETIERGYLGVSIGTLSDEQRQALGLAATVKGAIIAEVTPGGPSDRAGLQLEDLVVALNGKAIETSTELTRQVANAASGDILRLEVLREGRRLTVNVRAGRRPSQAELLAGQGGDEQGARFRARERLRLRQGQGPLRGRRPAAGHRAPRCVTAERDGLVRR